MLLAIVLVLFFIGGLCLVLMVIMLHKLFGRKLAGRVESLEKNEEDLSKNVEQINKARANDSKELKERLERLEEKVELLAKPHSREKEVEMEKAFARRK